MRIHSSVGFFLSPLLTHLIFFSQYRETCEVLLDYPQIGGVNVKDYSKQAIRNLFHANSDVHSRRLIAEFPKDGIKIFQNAQALSVSEGNSYTEDQIMHTFLDNFQQSGKYSAQLASHQAELRREKNILIKNA